MEDSHIAISDLGGEHGGLSVFGVFDGHGGREVAAFVRERLPDELRRQLDGLRASSGGLSPTPTSSSGGLLGEALTAGFHAIDDMLRAPENERTLLSMKQQAKQPAPRASSGEGGEVGKSAAPNRPKPRVLSFLQNSIKSDLAQARVKGSLTREEAAHVMMKMALLRRLEDQGPAAENPDAAVADLVGCTAVCVFITDSEVVCANAGDSRAVLCRKGEAVPLSHDHKPNDERELRRIEAAGGRVEEMNMGVRVQYRVNGNLNLSRALGDLEYKKRSDLGPEQQVICATPDIIALPRTEDDEFIAIACDGVWDVKTNQEVCDFVGSRLKRGEDLVAIVEDLLDDCVAVDPKETHGLGADNMTCVVVRLQQPPSGAGAPATSIVPSIAGTSGSPSSAMAPTSL